MASSDAMEATSTGHGTSSGNTGKLSRGEISCGEFHTTLQIVLVMVVFLCQTVDFKLKTQCK